MTEKEFRKLRPLDLIQILLTQNNEEARIQEELDRQKEYLDGLRTHNENLKTLLNDKDALIETLKQDLNQSDATIRDLREELKALYADKRINLENIGSLTEVAKRVNQIFATAQREAEEYLAQSDYTFAIAENSVPGNIALEEPERPEPRGKASRAAESASPETLIPEAPSPCVETASSRAGTSVETVSSETETSIETASSETEASVETASSGAGTSVETASSGAEASEYTEPSVKDVPATGTEEGKADSVIPDSPDPCDTDAVMEKEKVAGTGAEPAENITSETIPRTMAAARHMEPHQNKTTQPHSHQNKGLLGKFMGGIRRKKGGK